MSPSHSEAVRSQNKDDDFSDFSAQDGGLVAVINIII